MTPTIDDAGKEAYVNAQKQRNLAIGAGLLIFVTLVFFVTMARMSHNMKAATLEKARAAASAQAH